MRGVSPLIGAVIVVGITFALAIMVSSWTKSLAKEEAEKTVKGSGIECPYATVAAEEVVYFTDKNQMKIKVRASGSVAVEIEKVMVYNDTFIKTYRNGADFNLPILEPGDVYYIYLYNLPPNVTEVRVIPSECKMNAISVSEDEMIIY